ncbi:probable ATP-dependent RNA helicase DDX28 [Centruroides vittatus]|uniref:probable ATP-dependent RNA helicase DDX28 n=1 Tax=Centruroides vittatus TaxID=120091 RepID=UPI0035100BE3
MFSTRFMQKFDRKSILLFSEISLFRLEQCTNYSLNDAPVITVPAYMKTKLKALKKKTELQKIEEIRKKSRGGNRSVPIIQCKRSEFNHYLGQVYDKYEAIALASKGWKHRKSVGDYFTINGYGENPSIYNENFDEENTFELLKLQQCILKKLKELNFHNPTVIQRLSIPKILEYKHVQISAETGSGKTIAYLAPILHHLIELQKYQQAEIPSNCPLALILVPSKELAEQIGNVARQLSDAINVKVIVGGKFHQNKPDDFHNEIIVSTIGIFEKLVNRRVYDLSYVRHIVIDEADTLLDDSFNYTLKNFLKKVNIQVTVPTHPLEMTGAQLILCSATFPRNIDEVLSTFIDVSYIESVKTDHLHRLIPHIPQKFIRVKGSERTGPLVELVKKDLRKNDPVMIFCNKTSTNVWMSFFLNDLNVPNICLNGGMELKERDGQFRKFQNGECNVITCTDIASRGLDTIRVKHIINFDFPLHVSDYIHRIGRTGRLGSPKDSHVTNFICTPYNVDLVNSIELAVRRCYVLPQVDANITRKFHAMYGDRLETDINE